MDVKNEENKRLVTRCSKLENSLESMKDDILDLKDRLEDQIDRNQDLKEQLSVVLELMSTPNLEDDHFGLDEI